MDLDSIKSTVRAVLLAQSCGVLAKKFPFEFQDTCGMPLPMKQLNLRNVVDLPKLMPDVLKAERNAQGDVVFYALANAKVAHIVKMKMKEKSKTKKNRRSVGAKKFLFEDSDAAAMAGAGRSSVVRPSSSSWRPPVTSNFNNRPTPSNYKPPANSYKPPSNSYKPPVNNNYKPPVNNNYKAPTPSNNRPSSGLFSRPGQSAFNGHNSKPAAPRFTQGGTDGQWQRDRFNRPASSSSSSSTIQNVPPRFQQQQQARPAPAPAAKPVVTPVSGQLTEKIRVFMREYEYGLSSKHLVRMYEDFFKETAEPDLLKKVLQMDGSVVRVDSVGDNYILYGLEDGEEEEEEETPPPRTPSHTPSTTASQTNGTVSEDEVPQYKYPSTSAELATPPVKRKYRYPETYRYTHAHLPWLGVSVECYVTLVHSPSDFWVQIKSDHLTDLETISPEIQLTCERMKLETNGRFFVRELVCGLYEGAWYRAIVLDVGGPNNSAFDRLDKALLMPDKPTPQFSWRDDWQVQLFFIDYGNTEWVDLASVRRKKYTYPPGQAFRCALGSVAPVSEWEPAHVEHFRRVTTVTVAEKLKMTVESVKSEKAHYGFKSRLNEYCQRNRIEQAVYDRPLNSDRGWRTSVTIRHPTKGPTRYQGFYQNKKNDAEASAAQHVIRDWDIQLLQSYEIPDHWIEVLLMNKESGECFNQSLVEVKAAIPKTSIYDMCIPFQPTADEVPMPKSELVFYTSNGNGIASEDSTEEDDLDGGEGGLVEPELLELPTVGQLIMMEVNHVESLRNICCRPVEGNAGTRLIEMEDEMTSYMELHGVILEEPSPGMLCSALQDKIFYRTKILRITRNKEGKVAEVLMLDYGDTVEYELEELYEIEQRFLTLPFQAVSCILYGLEKVINEELIIKDVKNSIEGKQFLCKIKDRVNERTLIVELYTDDDKQTNKNELFLAMDVRNLRPSIKADDEAHPVKVTNVSDEGVLSLQVISGAGLQSLNELMGELKAHYEGGKTRASDYIQIPEPEQMCCTFSLRDGEKQWYRAVIKRLVTDYEVEVTYVDYGSSETILKSCLRVPARSIPNLSRLPFQAYRVRLDGLPVESAAWTELEVGKVKAYLANQTNIQAQVVGEEGGFPLVRLFLCTEDDSTPLELNNLLTGDSNLFRKPALEQLGLEMVNFSISSHPTFIETRNIVRRQMALPNLKLRMEMPAFICHVIDPYRLWFQFTEYSPAFVEMAENLNAFYSRPVDHDALPWESQNMCVVYSAAYESWYRAKIVRLIDQEQFLCHMVDYGNEEVIPLVNLRPLHSSFAHLPMMAVKASLYGVKPVGDSWSDTAIKFFVDTVYSKCPWIRIEKQARDSVQIHMIDTSGADDVHLSSLLIERGFALPT